MSRSVLARARHRTIPLSIIAGPRGGGKTTLLRALLSRPEGRNVGVAFSRAGQQVIADDVTVRANGPLLCLPNGCVCPALDGDVPASLQLLHDAIPACDHVVVEAPADATFERGAGYAYMPGYRPGGCIVVVGADDVARAIIEDPAPDEPLPRQLARADLVVVTRVDRAAASNRRAALRWIARSAPHARVVESESGAVPTAMLVGSDTQHASSHATLAEWTPGYVVDAPPRSRRLTCPRHDDDYRAWHLETDEPIDLAAFRQWAGGLPDSLLRGDGQLRPQSDPRRVYRFRLCGARWSLDADPDAVPLQRSWVTLVGLSALSRLSADDARLLEVGA